MDEEEELENILIGQQEEEAPAVNTGDALIGKPNFLPYANDVAPSRVNALSVFTPDGDLKPGIDVNAITPSPTTLPAPSAVNTALNQEVAVGSPSQGPSYFQRLGEFSKSVLNRDQGLFDVDRLSTAADNLLGSAMRNLTPVEDRRFANNEPFGKTFTDTFAITRPDGTKFYPDEGTNPGGTTQAPSGASALGATQGVTPPVERPMAGAQEQPEAVVSPFLQSPDTPSGLGGPLLRGFEMVNDAARGPNAPMGQDATRARLGGMTLNEYLNAPAGTSGVSGLRTDPQGRMITPAAPVSVNNFAPQASGSQVGPAKVPDEIMSQVVRTGAQTAEFRDGNRDGIEDREQGIFRPDELIGYDAQGNEVRSPGTQQPVNRIPASSQTPVDSLSSFEQASLERQQRIGGTGSFAGDSAAREARLAERDRLPGETQTERDTRIAQSRTTGGQTAGLSFDDARRRAEGQLAARGIRNPSVSQINALARSIQAAEPERLAELETKRALDAIKLRDAEAKKDFKPQIVEIGDQKLIQLSPNYYQPVRPEPTEEEPFEPRVLEEGGFTYYEVAPNRFERQPSTKAGGAAGEVSSAIADAIAAGGEEVATPAPTSTSPAPVRVNSQAEYDALPAGTPYIDSQGTPGTKK
jgi:hypothetical protein